MCVCGNTIDASKCLWTCIKLCLCGGGEIEEYLDSCDLKKNAHSSYNMPE